MQFFYEQMDESSKETVAAANAAVREGKWLPPTVNANMQVG